MTRGKTNAQGSNHCCTRFSEAVAAEEIMHSADNDETEWFIDGLWHIYFCPFCGTDVRGSGWGEYGIEMSRGKGRVS